MGEAARQARQILFVCDFNTHGGTQTHLLHLLARLDRARFRPRLAAITLHPDLGARLRALDVEVEDLRLRGALRPHTLRVAARLGAQARGGRALIQGYLYQGNLLAAAAAAVGGASLVTSVRNMDLWKRRRHRAASALAHRLARRVVFNSRAVRDHTVPAERIPPDRAIVIANGVPDPSQGAARRPAMGEQAGPAPSSQDASQAACPTALCVASLRSKKDHETLLEAFSRVRRVAPSARLVLAGEGPLRDTLEARAREAGLDGTIVFAGHQGDVSGLLAGADAFVLSSLEEGLPNALLEAMARGLPAVVTDVGGNAEAVEEGMTGFLVPPRRPDLLAERLERLLSDAALRRRLGEAARRRYESRFRVETMVAAYEALYEEVLA